MKAQKQHINSFGYSFSPDFNREVSLAAQVIQSFAKQKLESGGNTYEITVDEMKMLHASATRIIDEMKAAAE